MSVAFRRLIPTLALVAVVGGACEPPKQPTKPSPPEPGQFLSSYFAFQGGSGFRSSAPTAFSLPTGTAAQALAPDGSVVLALDDVAAHSETGVQTYPFPLGHLQRVDLELADAGLAGVWLFLDTGGDGQFFQWNGAGAYTGAGGDKVASGPLTFVNSDGIHASITSTTELILCPPPPDACAVPPAQTLADLKSGAAPGIDADTLAAVVVVGVNHEVEMFPVDRFATVKSLKVNGVELLVP